MQKKELNLKPGEKMCLNIQVVIDIHEAAPQKRCISAKFFIISAISMMCNTSHTL
jgi:hypothetical protein